MSVDSRVASDEALLLDALNGSVSAASAYDDALAAFQADLDAFDAFIASSELLLHTTTAVESPGIRVDVQSAVDDYACNDKSCSDTSSSSNVSGNAIAPAVKKPRCAPGGNAARKRQRDEIHTLRESAELLEKELQTLTAIAKRSSSDVHSSSSSSSSSEQGRRGPDTHSSAQCSKRSTASPPPQSTNATLLVNEDQARRLAELENIQLSKLVNSHLVVTKRFKKALFKRLTSVDSECSVDAIVPTVRGTKAPSTASYLRVLKTLGMNLDTQHLELERVFRVAGLTNRRTDMIETRVGMDHAAGGVATLQFKLSHFFPFSMQAINALTPKTVEKRHRLEHKKWRSEPFHKEFQAGDTTVSIRNVGKRHVENDRIVVVWEGLSEWLDNKSGELVAFHEKGWSIIQSFPQTSASKKQQDASSLPLSIMQTFSCMTPIESGAANWEERHVRRHLVILANTVKLLYEQQVAARVQDLENALLDESLKRSP